MSTTPARPRLVRRQPMLARLQAYLNPLDFLLWLSEELNSSDWEDFQKQWATPAGITLNIVFMIARANATSSEHRKGDDIFGDEHSGTGWLSWFASFLVHLLSLFSFANAFFTFWRRRHYRLFESSIDVAPNTPSAHRVRVDSSPMTSSPLKFFSSVITAASAGARSHPDASRDVWELALWDPTPLSLSLFCMFSPGHILVYWLFLPLDPLDPRPSVTVVTTLVLATLLSTQLTLLQKYFSQQAKDESIIFREVQNEYDTKFVRPTINKPVRDAGTQILTSTAKSSVPEVLVSTPHTYVNRGFRTNPNPNYAAHLTEDVGITSQAAVQQRLARAVTSPNLHSSFTSPATSTPADASSPLRSSGASALQQPNFRPGSRGDGGNLGVYSHAMSPFRKQQHTPMTGGTPNQRLSAVPSSGRPGSPTKLASSPLKRVEMSGRGSSSLENRFGQLKGGAVKRDAWHR